MGVMRFLVPRRDWVAADAVDRAYMAGLDEIPGGLASHWTDHGLGRRTRRKRLGQLLDPLLCRRPRRTDALHGQPDGARAALPPASRAGPRNAEPPAQPDSPLGNRWGWQSPADVCKATGDGPRTFVVGGHAARRSDKQPPSRLRRPLQSRLEAIGLLVALYVEQALAARHQQAGKLSTLLGHQSGGLPAY